MHDDVDKAVRHALAQLVLDQPFFGTIALRLGLKRDDNMNPPTLGTDARSIRYHGDYIQELTKKQIQSELAHEVMHVVFEHPFRRGHRDHQRWNVAGDCIIDPLLRESGFEPVPLWRSPADFGFDEDGWTTDALYERLPHDHSGGCGKLWDASGNANDGGLTAAEKAQLAVDVKDMITSGYHAAKQQGLMPAGLERVVQEIIDPAVDWRSQLRHFIDVITRDDYDWSRPNRRHIQRGFALPSLYSKKLGEVVVVSDESGSIGPQEKKQFAGELSSVLADCMPEAVHVVYCDADVQGHETFYPDDLPLTMHGRGGGGTRYTPAFDWVEDQGIQPKVLIYLTDLCCDDFPAQAPDYPVIWASTLNVSSDAVPFGDVVVINDYH